MIKDIIQGLLEMYKTRDPFELCSYLDIIVCKHSIGEKIKGFFQKTPDNTEIIHINSDLDEYTQKYVCAHELGHAILDPSASIRFFINNPLQIKNKSEIKMDKFAAELLIEDNIMKKYPNMTIEQISAAEYIPIKLIKLKFDLFF